MVILADFSVSERRYRHCGQSRDEDGGNVKNLEDQMKEGFMVETRGK